MSDMPELFDDENITPVPLEQVVFDYRLISADKREFVMQKTDETQILLKRTTEKIIQIGKNLQEVKNTLPRGMFLPWIRSEFGMSRQTADRFMQVADRFGDKVLTVSTLSISASALYLLASTATPQEAIDETFQRAETGENITKELAKQIIEAQEAIKQAQEAEAKAKAEALVAQQQLFNTEFEASSKIEELAQQIESLQEEMDRLVKPEVQIQLKEVLPPEKQAELEELQEKVRVLESELENEKVTVPEEKQEELALLKESVAKLEQDLEKERKAVPLSTQKKLEKMQEEINNLESMKAFQTERIGKLEEDMRIALLAKEAAENADRVRQSWRIITNDVHSSLMKLLSQWPTLIDVKSFGDDEWERLASLQSTLRRVLEECDNLYTPITSTSPRMLRPLPSQAAE